MDSPFSSFLTTFITRFWLSTMTYLIRLICSLFLMITALYNAPAIAQTPSEQDDGQTLVSGEGVEITTTLINQELGYLPPHRSQQLRRNEQALRELINDLYRRDAIVALAEQQHIEDLLPLASYRLERARREELLAMMLDYKRLQIATNFPDFTERARELFLINQERYQVPEMIQVSHILLKAATPEDKTARYPEAETILEEINNGGDFAELATRYSEDDSNASRGGRLDFFSHGTMVPEFEQAAFALREPGEVTGIVSTAFGLHIIRLEGRRPAQVRSFDDIKDTLITKLKQEYLRDSLRDWYQEVTDSKHAHVDREALEAYIQNTLITEPPAQRIPETIIPVTSDSPRE
jgi:peptidyl-prolyl cis-trans isomerase C